MSSDLYANHLHCNVFSYSPQQAVSRHIRDVIREVGETNAAIARDTQETVRREVVSEIMQQFSSATGEVVEQVTDILEETLPI